MKADPRPMAINAWSYSRLQVGEACGYRARLAYIDKVPEPTRAVLPAAQEYPDERGARIHTAAERFVLSDTSTLAPELAKHFAPEFHKLRALHTMGVVTCEQSWEYDDAWRPLAPLGAFPSGSWSPEFATRFFKIWVRIKLDASVFLSPTEAVFIDYKTGRRFGNEVKHGEQMQLYQLGAFLKYPTLQRATTELWYLDQNERAAQTFTRAQGLRFLRGFNARGIAFTSMSDFTPQPNQHNCRWCPYKTGALRQGVNGTGHCDKNPP